MSDDSGDAYDCNDCSAVVKSKRYNAMDETLEVDFICPWTQEMEDLFYEQLTRYTWFKQEHALGKDWYPKHFIKRTRFDMSSPFIITVTFTSGGNECISMEGIPISVNVSDLSPRDTVSGLEFSLSPFYTWTVKGFRCYGLKALASDGQLLIS